MDIFISTILQIIFFLVLVSVVRWLVKNLQIWFPRKENKGKRIRISSKGWYGIKPTVWDSFFLVFFALFVSFCSLFILLIINQVHEYILREYISNTTDIFITPYGFGGFAYYFLGVGLSFFIVDPISDFLLLILKRITNKSQKQLIPAISGQNKMLGVNENMFKKFWVRLCLILFIISIPAFFSFTRFSEDAIYQRSWPGILETKYTYTQISDIWDVKQFRNKVTGDFEPTAHHYVIEFTDGWEWSTNQLPLGSSIQVDALIDEVAERSGKSVREGIDNVDL